MMLVFAFPTIVVKMVMIAEVIFVFSVEPVMIMFVIDPVAIMPMP